MRLEDLGDLSRRSSARPTPWGKDSGTGTMGTRWRAILPDCHGQISTLKSIDSWDNDAIRRWMTIELQLHHGSSNLFSAFSCTLFRKNKLLSSVQVCISAVREHTRRTRMAGMLLGLKEHFQIGCTSAACSEDTHSTQSATEKCGQ